MKSFLAAALLVLAAAPASAARLERGPYLENMTKDMVTVRFRGTRPPGLALLRRRPTASAF